MVCQILLKNKFSQIKFLWSSSQPCIASVMCLKLRGRKFSWTYSDPQNFSTSKILGYTVTHFECVVIVYITIRIILETLWYMNMKWLCQVYYGFQTCRNLVWFKHDTSHDTLQILLCWKCIASIRIILSIFLNDDGTGWWRLACIQLDQLDTCKPSS